MEVHRPKSLHGWGELAKEVGIIVLGVLIAISAEQTVEVFHWRHKVREAGEAMRLELRDDDGPQAYLRVAVQGCLDRQLDAIQAAIEANGTRPEIASLIGDYKPPSRTWDSEAWRAAVASDVGSHVSAEQMIDWSKPYRSMPRLQAVNAQERVDLVELQPTRHVGERLSPGEADAMLSAIQRLRADNRGMSSLSRSLLFGMEKFGMNLTSGQQRQTLDSVRTRYGDCVVVPSTAGFNPTNQLDSER